MKRIALLLLLTACPKEKSSTPDAAAAAPVVRPSPRGPTLTPQVLDAYLQYQAAWVGDSPEGARRLDRAAREQAALKASGLTEEQITMIDEMVSAVIARRMLTQLSGSQALVPDVGNMPMPPEQKKAMDQALAQLKLQQQAARELTDERKQFGSANIDVLLTREAELTKMWSDMMGLGAYATPTPTMPVMPVMPGAPDAG